MTVLTQRKPRRNTTRLLTVIALPIVLTACEPDSQSLIDPSALFSPIAIAANPANNVDPTESEPGPDPVTDPVTNPGNEPTTETPTGPTTPASPPTAPSTPSSPPPTVGSTSTADEALQLLTRGPINVSMRFNADNTLVTDQFSFSESDYDVTSGGLPVLSTLDTVGPAVCSFVEATQEYLCLRAFDFQLINRVWYLYSLDNSTSGSGVFESCDANDTQDACSSNLTGNPDGTITVSIGANIGFENLPNPAPYLAYGAQGSAERSVSNNSTVAEEYRNAVYAIEALAAER